MRRDCLRSAQVRFLAALLTLGCACDGALESLIDPSAGLGATSTPEQTLFVGRPADAIRLDPARVSDNESVEVVSQLFEPLVRYQANSTEVEPALATSWEVSADGTAWTFALRRGVRFHDGTVMDARAVEFSFRRQLDRAHPQHQPDFQYWEGTFANMVKDVAVVDDHTVRITIFRPFGPFLASLAMHPVSIVSPTAVRADPEGFARKPVGTGPFRFVSWVPGDRIVLARNDAYWGEHAHIARLVYRRIADTRQRLIALEGGSIHVAYGLLPEELQFVALHPELALERIPGANVAYLAMHTQKPPFDDVRVRRAVNQAVNKVPIVKLVYQGQAIAAKGALPPTIWSYRADLPDITYDPVAARVVIDAAIREKRYDPTKRLQFFVPRTPRPYLPRPEVVARVIQRNLAEIGIQSDLVVQDFREHLASTEKGEHDLCLLGWAGDNGDPDNFLYTLLDQDNAVVGRANNVAFYISARVHGLLSYAQTATDRAERERYYVEAQQLIAADAPWVPLAHSEIIVARRRNVIDLSIHPSAVLHFARVAIR